MKRVMFVTVVMALLMGISTNAMAGTARARSRERFNDSYVGYYGARSCERFNDSYVGYYGARSRERFNDSYVGYYRARSRERFNYYGHGYGYGPIYDRYEYTHTAPGYRHHVYDRRSGGVITGIGELLFGKRELDINIEEGYPSE